MWRRSSRTRDSGLLPSSSSGLLVFRSIFAFPMNLLILGFSYIEIFEAHKSLILNFSVINSCSRVTWCGCRSKNLSSRNLEQSMKTTTSDSWLYYVSETAFFFCICESWGRVRFVWNLIIQTLAYYLQWLICQMLVVFDC
jgi:hypothetical protein